MLNMKILAIRLQQNYLLNWIQKYLMHMHSYDVYVYLGRTNIHMFMYLVYSLIYKVLSKEDTEHLIKSNLYQLVPATFP